jgi:hypothetical protein
MPVLSSYLTRIEENLAAGDATEHTHRSALESLLETNAENVSAFNEPKRIACGAPDLRVQRDGRTIGYVEAKDVGTSLDAAEDTDQLRRYKAALPSLVLTDYLEFRWFVDGEHRRTARLAHSDSDETLTPVEGGAEQVNTLLEQVLGRTPAPIAGAQMLATRLAQATHMIHDIVVAALAQDEASDLLVDLRRVFADALIPDLDAPEKADQFADMYAQTLAYGLFAARVNHNKSEGPFRRLGAAGEIPKTNPFLRRLFSTITGPDLDDEPYAGFVDDLVQILDHANIHEVLADFGERTRQEDPVVHFYETFLKEYDPDLRVQRGVFYTPAPVVSYITRSVDRLLETHFDLDGLADTTTFTHRYEDADGTMVEEEEQRVLVLDPACGTGTFLYHIVDHLRSQFMETGNAGMWSAFVRDHLLPRLFGFELLMAPYAVAHLKLGLQLAGQDLPNGVQDDWRYDFESDERLSLYLTNTLEDPEQEIKRYPGPLRIVSEEAEAAAEVKNAVPLLVITGNPPYSNFGQMNDAPWISETLMSDWKPRGEKKWNPDDFMKFMRWAEWKLNQSGQGVLAFITSRTYLDRVNRRTMREHLHDTFDAIHLLDLHGGIYETPPDGIDDENVFDITKGVAIGLFVKTPEPADEPQIHYHELWGGRDEKYAFLDAHDVGDTEWETLSLESPYHLFIPQEASIAGEYNGGPQIQNLFQNYTTGVQTNRDALATDFSVDTLLERISEFAESSRPISEIERQFDVQEARYWSIEAAQEALKEKGADKSQIEPYYYRPFDRRHIYYSPAIVHRTRGALAQHVTRHRNISMLVTRGCDNPAHGFCLVTADLADKRALASPRGEAKQLFLYCYPSDEHRATNGEDMFNDAPDGRRPNLTPDFVETCTSRWGLDFVTDGTGDLETTFGPEDVLHYAYALFHSPTYRRRYEELLRIDFPRLPLTSDLTLLRALCEQGRALVNLHLMNVPLDATERPSFPVGGSNEIISRHPRYAPPDDSESEEGRVYINEEQYFEGVEPAVWRFHVGGYQVCQKWLKDRKGRALDRFDDLRHYQNVVATLRRTMERMDTIDTLIDEHGGWPLPGSTTADSDSEPSP